MIGKNTTLTYKKKKKEKKGFIINLMPWAMQVSQLLKLSFGTSKTLNDDYRQCFQHFEP
jgi:invasion protein IalB